MNTKIQPKLPLIETVPDVVFTYRLLDWNRGSDHPLTRRLHDAIDEVMQGKDPAELELGILEENIILAGLYARIEAPIACRGDGDLDRAFAEFKLNELATKAVESQKLDKMVSVMTLGKAAVIASEPVNDFSNLEIFETT